MTRAEHERRVAALKQRFAPLFADSHIGHTIAPGWFDLVEDLCTGIHAALAEHERSAVHFQQIKEKFGGIRCYLNIEPPCVDLIGRDCYVALRRDPLPAARDPSALYRRLAPLVEAAEEASRSRCLFCGAPGRLRDSRAWILTLCERHAPYDYRHLDAAFAMMTDPDRDPRPPELAPVVAALRAAELELRAWGVTRLGVVRPTAIAVDWRLVVDWPDTLAFKVVRLLEKRVGWPVQFATWPDGDKGQAEDGDVACAFGKRP